MQCWPARFFRLGCHCICTQPGIVKACSKPLIGPRAWDVKRLGAVLHWRLAIHNTIGIRMRALIIKKKIVSAAVLFALCLQAHAGTDIPYLEKRLGLKTVKLPKLNDFSPACEENAQLAQRAAAMAPKSSTFLTCLVDAKKWLDYRTGKSTDLYPLIAVTVQIPQPGGDFTLEEFKKIRAAAHNQLGDLLADSQYAQRQLKEEDRTLASSGMNITRENYQQALQGFFEPAGATSSFSYLVSRSSTISEAGTTKKLMEVNAVSTIYYSGKLLGLSVIDVSFDNNQGLRARDITAKWLRSFRELNEYAAK